MRPSGSSTSQSPLPLRALYLSESSTSQSPLPLRTLYLSEPSTYRNYWEVQRSVCAIIRALYLSEPSTSQSPLPLRVLYFSKPCTSQSPEPFTSKSHSPSPRSDIDSQISLIYPPPSPSHHSDIDSQILLHLHNVSSIVTRDYPKALLRVKTTSTLPRSAALPTSADYITRDVPARHEVSDVMVAIATGLVTSW